MNFMTNIFCLTISLLYYKDEKIERINLLIIVDSNYDKFNNYECKEMFHVKHFFTKQKAYSHQDVSRETSWWE